MHEYKVKFDDPNPKFSAADLHSFQLLREFQRKLIPMPFHSSTSRGESKFELKIYEMTSTVAPSSESGRKNNLIILLTDTMVVLIIKIIILL